jgi:hypothetical protein
MLEIQPLCPAPVMIAAEEWSDEVELVDNRSEMTRQDDRNA